MKMVSKSLDLSCLKKKKTLSGSSVFAFHVHSLLFILYPGDGESQTHLI